MRAKSCVTVILLALGTVAVSCDKGTPVAPQGALLSVTASPNEIGVFGTSTVTVVAQRGNGVPVNPGTEIQLSTTLGELPPIVTTDSRGIARAQLRAGDRTGVARITASSGTAEAAAVEVQVGFRPGTLVLQVSPQTVAQSGGTVAVTAVIVDEQGAPLSGASVAFSAPVGTFSANPVRSDGQGRAATTLSLTASELRSHSGDHVEVRADVSAAGSQTSSTARIQIRRPPVASFTSVTSGLQVIFTDTSTGLPTSWVWRFGDGNSRGAQNPVHTYAVPGTYAVTLQVANPEGSDMVTQFVTVTAQ